LSGWRALKPVLANSLALLPGTAIGSLVVLVEQAIAASLGEGSNAALLYGYRLPAALQSLFVTAIGITALPYFASHIAQMQHAYCLHSLKRLFWALGIGGMLIALPLVIFSPEITVLLYQRGAFDTAAVARVVPIQIAYFIQIPFALLAMLGIKTLAALGRNTQVSLIAATAAILQGMLGYFLARQFGAAGIAWAATTISALIATISFIAARAVLKQHTP
ncbi:MAG: lipid II flippase MurJ, partial [Thiobacillus sp.]